MLGFFFQFINDLLSCLFCFKLIFSLVSFKVIILIIYVIYKNRDKLLRYVLQSIKYLISKILENIELQVTLSSVVISQLGKI